MVEMRNALFDDVEGIAKVHVDTWRTTYQGIVPADFLERLSYEKRAAMWRDVIQRATPKEHLLVATDADSKVIGFTAGGANRSLEHPFDGELFAIYLLKEHQGRGIGRRLFQATVDRLGEHGFSGMLIWVLEGNATRQFYERMGGLVCSEKFETLGGKLLKELAYGWSALPKGDAGVTTRALEPSLWPALEQFFLSEKCNGCWCMNHRLKPGESLEGEPARLGLAAGVSTRQVSGILAFDGEKPIGWCAFDRTADLPGLDCARPVSVSEKDDIWSIHCVSVLSAHPKDEIAELMVAAAVSSMKQSGAKVIESYPPPSLPSDNSFSGTISIFESQGFRVQEPINRFYTRMTRSVEMDSKR